MNKLAIIALSRVADVWEREPRNPHLSDDWNQGRESARSACVRDLRAVIEAMQEDDETLR